MRPVGPRRPQITQINADLFVRNFLHDEVPAAERRPGTAGPDVRSECERSSRQSGPVACAKRAQASPLLFPFCWMKGAPRSQQKRGKAEPTRLRRGGRWEARRRRTLASGGDGLSTGCRRSFDRRQFRRQSPALPHHISNNLFAPWQLCVLAFRPSTRIPGGSFETPSVFICVICGQVLVCGKTCVDLRDLRFILFRVSVS